MYSKWCIKCKDNLTFFIFTLNSFASDPDYVYGAVLMLCQLGSWLLWMLLSLHGLRILVMLHSSSFSFPLAVYVEQLLVLAAVLKASGNIHDANKTMDVFSEFTSRFRGTCAYALMQQESARKEHVSCKDKLIKI
jgi:hypothetical protein